ncbi:hypothetical protein, partial [Hyalangium versicolor]|uniref:hypothetical protein n=1 Tax=Hyalangium versicolor TaxID=2861190 RepID=UPI001CC96C9B
TTAECILGNAATADGTVGQLSVINTSFGSCAGGVINVNGPMYLFFQDTGSGSSGSTPGYALLASEGARIRLSSVTATTGTLGDLVLDEPSSATSLSALRALSPKRITNTAGSVIFER